MSIVKFLSYYAKKGPLFTAGPCKNKLTNFEALKIQKLLLFQRCHVARSTGYRNLASESLNPSERTFHNDPAVKETRGRLKLIYLDEDLLLNGSNFGI